MESEKKSLKEQMPYLPEALQEKALNVLGRYLIYYNLDERTREAVCTKCGRTVVAEKGDTGRFGDLWKAKHREDGRCPCCDAKVKYIAHGRMKNFSSLHKAERFVFVWAENHDRIWMMAAHAWDEINGNGITSELHYAPDRIWLLTPGKVECERVTHKYWCVYWNGIKPYQYCSGWTHSTNPYREPYQPFMGNGGDYWNVPEKDEDGFLLQKTFLMYAEKAFWSCNEDMDRCDLIFMAQYPKLSEMLLKLGAKWVIEDKIYRKQEHKRLLDWNAPTPHGFFRLDKASFEVWHSHECSETALELYHAGKKVKGFTMEAACRIAEKYKSDGIHLVRAAKWLGVKVETVEAKIAKKKYPLVEWYDYLSAAKKLKYDLKNPVVIYPKNLKAAHDHATAQLAIRVSKAAQKAYMERKVALSHRYCYCDGEFFIRPPFSQEEIIREGKMMHHCVGTYAERHMKGETDILFMRRCDKPDTPLYTIEIKDGYERQIRGKSNGPVKLEAEKKFHEGWLKWVQEGSKPEDKPKITPKAKENIA